jgi:micrococcal nuclease
MKYWQIVMVGLLVVIAWGAWEYKGFATTESLKRNEALQDKGIVLKIIDGDTVEVFIDNKTERVRLIGIDAPEMSSANKECFAKEAHLGLKKLLDGKQIILESDPTQENRDEYGRLLRYVFLDKENINKMMIERGFAYELTFMGKAYNYQSKFVESEEKAKEGRKGLWKSC